MSARAITREVTGLILAGGQSRRFGSSKARHAVQGQPMLAHVYEALRAATARKPLISVRPGMGPFFSLEAQYVEDCVSDAGPLAGLHAGLQATETPWLLAVACDMPFLTPAALRSLIEERTPETGAVVATTPGGRRQPLCACYRCDAVLPAVRRHLDDRRLALHALLGQLASVRAVSLPEAPLRNINERSDLPDAV